LFKRFSIDFVIFSIFLDACLVGIALKIAYLIRPQMSILSSFINDLPTPPALPIYLYIVFPVIWVLVFLFFSVYDSNKNFRVTDELSSIFWSSLLASTVIAGLLFLSYREVSRILFLTFIVISIFLLTFYRLFFRVLYRNGLKGSVKARRILIAGAGQVGLQMEKKVNDFKNLGLEIVGYVDDNPKLLKSKLPILGTLSDTFFLVKQYQIDDVILALPRSAYEKANKLVGELHALPVRIWVIPDYFALALNRAVILEFAGLPMIDLRAPAINDYQRLGKRIFDLAIAVPAVILLSPFFLIISIWIRLDSRGPAFYTSDRIGENGKTFRMVKFRSMVTGAEKRLHEVARYDEKGNLIHKTPNDSRITHAGKFLRRTSMDELPQLFNVLKGDMSLVGPRPELPQLVEKYEPWQRKRFAVPQGMTGWWQVNGRSDKPMHLHTDEDLYYIQHYSIWLDLQILLKTVWVVLRRKGAY